MSTYHFPFYIYVKSILIGLDYEHLLDTFITIIIEPIKQNLNVLNHLEESYSCKLVSNMFIFFLKAINALEVHHTQLPMISCHNNLFFLLYLFYIC